MNQATKRAKTVRRIVELLKAGITNRAIARELKVSRNRVSEVRTIALQHGYLGNPVVTLPPFPALIFAEEFYEDGRSAKSSDPDLKLLEHKPWIEERLLSNWKPITVYEELPLKGISRSSFYRFLNRHDLLKLSKKQTERDRRITPIIHEPGEALLLDWGKICDVIEPNSNKKKTLWAFVGVLGFSRFMTVRLVWTNNVPTTITALESILREIGGVPTRLTSDNPKCFAITASKFEPILNPTLERFASHYNFILECLPPYDPQKKGKVERLIPFVRRLFEAYDFLNWKNLDHAQTYIENKCTIANERNHGTTRKKPIEEFLNIEAAKLKTLPPLAYSVEEFSQAKVRRDGFARFQNKYYAVHDKFIHKTVQILGSKNSISIFHKGILIENYTPLTNPHEFHATKEYLQKPWEKLIHNHGHYLDRANILGPNVARIIQIILEKNNGFVDTRKIWGILSLDKNYSAIQIDEACNLAIAINNISFRGVLNILTLKPHLKKNPENYTQKNYPPPKFAVSIDDYKQQIDLLN